MQKNYTVVLYLELFKILFDDSLDMKNKVQEYELVHYFMLNLNNIIKMRKVQTENICTSYFSDISTHVLKVFLRKNK